VTRRRTVRASMIETAAAETVKIPVEELVAAGVLVFTPLWGYLLARATGAGLAPRYVFCTVAGWGLLASYLVEVLTRGRPVTRRLLVAGASLAALFLIFLPYTESGPLVADLPALVAADRTPDPAQPIVVDGALFFLGAKYYSPEPLRSRLCYVADPRLALSFVGTDTDDRGLFSLGRHAPINVETREAFLRDHSAFLLIGFPDPGWFRTYLVAQGYHVTLLAERNVLGLFRVSR